MNGLPAIGFGHGAIGQHHVPAIGIIFPAGVWMSHFYRESPQANGRFRRAAQKAHRHRLRQLVVGSTGCVVAVGSGGTAVGSIDCAMEVGSEGTAVGSLGCKVAVGLEGTAVTSTSSIGPVPVGLGSLPNPQPATKIVIHKIRLNPNRFVFKQVSYPRRRVSIPLTRVDFRLRGNDR